MAKIEKSCWFKNFVECYPYACSCSQTFHSFYSFIFDYSVILYYIWHIVAQNNVVYAKTTQQQKKKTQLTLFDVSFDILLKDIFSF